MCCIVNSGSVGEESIFKMLHKPKIDNMPEYLERKQQRIKVQDDKRHRHLQNRKKRRRDARAAAAQKATSGGQQENQSKKPKTS